MPAIVLEWLNLLLRAAHVVAAIMWIGDSFLFMWLDATLERPAAGRIGDLSGEIWLTHSGGFYEIVKHRTLTALPRRLYWFKWQSYSTWISGILLLTVVYALGGQAMLVDAGSPLSHGAAVGIAFGAIAIGLLVYELLCRTPLARHSGAFGVVGLVLITALAAGLAKLLTARAAFLLTGATLGTIMTANVFLVIVPGQARMIQAMLAGRPMDPAHGVRAKRRSTDNHYLTFPVLLLMLSNHFPSFYGSGRPWLIVALLAIAGAGVKFAMNYRMRTPWPAIAGTLASFVLLGWLTAPPGDSAAVRALAAHAPVDIAAARVIVQTRCVTCHAAHPANAAFAAPPNGVMLESPEQMQAYAPKILVRVYETRTMPLGNLTNITDAERATLGAWAFQQRGK